MKILVFGNTYQGDKLPAVIGFLHALAGSDAAEIMVEPSFLDYIKKFDTDGFKPLDPDLISGDIALCFGGDGTVLSTARAIGYREIPVMGINTGHLGYLSGIGIDEAPSIIDDILQRRLVVEHRRMLCVESEALPADFHPFALNEVAILKRDSASMIRIDSTIDNRPLALYQADGLIVATPTGSTAYNLSIGGPIVDPGADVWVVAPVAPHSLTMRPLVVSDSAQIGVVVDSRTPSFRLSVDGRSVSLAAGTRLLIKRAGHSTLLARPKGHGFLDNLRNKLLWGK